MVSLPQAEHHDDDKGGCGTTCGAGLEKIYPSTAVRYGAMRMIGEFTYRPNTVFKCGAKVVVQTERGIELGEQVSLTCHGCDKSVSRDQISRYIQNSGPEFYRLGSGRILREATPQDVAEHDHLNSSTRGEADDCSLMAAQLGLEMKIVTVEHLLGGERVIYYFMADGRVDFRGLVKELAARHQTRIEMKQVGARDEARLVADYEICGRECCCKNFLKTLRPVTMKMAKVQKATLDLSKVSGRCGRLRCCLRYEHEGYESLERNLPRRGSRIRTEHGTGVVIDRQILTQLVMFRSDEGRVVTVPVEEIAERDLPPPPDYPAPASAERNGDAPSAGRDPDAPASQPPDARTAGSRGGRPPRPGERPRDSGRDRRSRRDRQPPASRETRPGSETRQGSDARDAHSAGDARETRPGSDARGRPPRESEPPADTRRADDAPLMPGESADQAANDSAPPGGDVIRGRTGDEKTRGRSGDEKPPGQLDDDTPRDQVGDGGFRDRDADAPEPEESNIRNADALETDELNEDTDDDQAPDSPPAARDDGPPDARTPGDPRPIGDARPPGEPPPSSRQPGRRGRRGRGRRGRRRGGRPPTP